MLCQPAYLLLVFEGVAHGVPGGTAALIAALQPLLVATVAGRLLGEPHHRGGCGSAWSSGWSAWLIVVSGDLAVSGAPLWAYLLPTAGMLCLTTGTVLERRLRPSESVLRDGDDAGRRDRRGALRGSRSSTGRATVPTDWNFWAAVVWLIVLASLGGYGIYVYVARTQGATVVSTLLYLTPPTTMVWVYLMFGTPLTLVARGRPGGQRCRRVAGAPRTTRPGARARGWPLRRT